MLEGRSKAQKRELAQTFAREMARICQCNEQGIHVVFDEVSKDNWSVGGELISDRANKQHSE